MLLLTVTVVAEKNRLCERINCGGIRPGTVALSLSQNVISGRKSNGRDY